MSVLFCRCFTRQSLKAALARHIEQLKNLKHDLEGIKAAPSYSRIVQDIQKRAPGINFLEQSVEFHHLVNVSDHYSFLKSLLPISFRSLPMKQRAIPLTIVLTHWTWPASKSYIVCAHI